MEPHFATAMSQSPNPGKAAEQVLRQIHQQMTPAVDLAMLFVTPDQASGAHRLAARLRDECGAKYVLGCTCAGVISATQEIEQPPAISLLAASLPGAWMVSLGHPEAPSEAQAVDPAAWRNQISQAGYDCEQLRALILLVDPFSTPTIELLNQLGDVFPGVPVIGGMASGASKPGNNRMMLNQHILDHGMVGVAIGGNVDIQTTVSQGCRPIGQSLVITRAKRHLVQELGGRPALKVVREMIKSLSQHDQQLIHDGGLMVGRVIDEYKSRFGRGDFLIRSVIGFDPQAGFVAIADPQIRIGQTIQFHVRDRKTAQEDFAFLLEAQRIHGPASGALLFTCNGRGTRLFDHEHADVTMIRHALGDIPLAGCFAAGEIGPVGGRNFVHGQSATLAVFRPGAPVE